MTAASSHCIHYGTCGGCAFTDTARIDKAALLANALRKVGYADAALNPLIEIPLRTRRRMDLAASRRNTTVTLGLHEARSSNIANMTECALLDPRLVALLSPLRVLLRGLESFRRIGSVIINLLDAGPDILLRVDADATGPDRTKLIAFARARNAVRISIAKGADEPDLVATLQPPVLTLSGIAVEPAPGAFLQASPEGEAAIIAAVLAALPEKPKQKIVELYAGTGTISFALVRYGRVEAHEGNPDAVATHETALRRANLAGLMSVTMRDLARRPLKISEFAGRAVAVLDPPYAGAGPQMKNLAASHIPCIIYISCNPGALAHDAAILRHAGYRLVSATPIDQFRYSENLESVVVFGKT